MINILHIANYTTKFTTGIKNVVEKLKYYQSLDNNVYEINLRQNSFFYNIKKIKNIILEENIDIVIIHGIYRLDAIIISNFLKKNKIPYVIVPHCSLTKISLNQKKIKKKLFNTFFKSFYKGASAIGFLNEEEKLNSISFNNKYIYLPNGIDKNKILKKIENEKLPQLNIVYLSRIDIYHKGIDLLLEALNLIKIKLEKKLVIVTVYGDGDKKDMDFFYKKIYEYSLEKVIKYEGRVEKEEKQKAFLKGDMFILTSRFEGFPMAVLEALSYGLPCILTDGTNMKSIVEKYNSGWVSSVKVEDISKTILSAIEEYECNKFYYRENAIKNSQDYSWEKIVDKQLDEYKKIILENRRRSNVII